MRQINSSFGASVEHDLRANGCDTLVIVGLTTNHCVSTMARVAVNFGSDTHVIEDATATYGRKVLDERPSVPPQRSAISRKSSSRSSGPTTRRRRSACASPDPLDPNATASRCRDACWLSAYLDAHPL